VEWHLKFHDGSHWIHKVFGFDVASPIEVTLKFEVNVLRVGRSFHKVLKIWRLCNVVTIIGMKTSIVIHQGYNQTIFLSYYYLQNKNTTWKKSYEFDKQGTHQWIHIKWLYYLNKTWCKLNMRWIKNIKSQFALARLKGGTFWTSIYIT
jgi:hypothetical protein